MFCHCRLNHVVLSPVYFLSHSSFAASLDKPFTAHYNPYTESIELLDNAEQLRDLSVSIQSEMSLLVAALSRRV